MENILSEGLESLQKSYLYSKKKQEEQKSLNLYDRPMNNKEQTTLKEFGGCMMQDQSGFGNFNANLATFRAGKNASQMPGKGNGLRGNIGGPDQALNATPSQSMIKPLQPTGGLTPYGNDRGPQKQVNDNRRDTVFRATQKYFGTGKNNQMAVNKMLDSQGFGKGPIGNMMNKMGSFMGLDQSVGRGIITADLFNKKTVGQDMSSDLKTAIKTHIGQVGDSDAYTVKHEKQSYDVTRIGNSGSGNYKYNVYKGNKSIGQIDQDMATNSGLPGGTSKADQQVSPLFACNTPEKKK